jgi:hypothetical protein
MSHHGSMDGDCFVWSMDSRLHRFFCRAFCVRNIAEQMRPFSVDSPSKKSINMRALSNAVASLTEHFCSNSALVNIYFVLDDYHEGIRMILPLHEEVILNFHQHMSVVEAYYKLSMTVY